MPSDAPPPWSSVPHAVKNYPRKKISKKQWHLKQYQMRCKECIDVYWGVQLKAPPKIEESTGKHASNLPKLPDGASCWICLEEGSDELWEPLGQDCLCRGKSTGFARISCLIKYAQKKSHNWDSCNHCDFMKQWKVCPYCPSEWACLWFGD